MLPAGAVPFKFSNLICTCSEPSHSANYIPGIGSACKNCNKRFRYDLRKCTECGDIYLASTFNSVLVCFKYPKCLNCISLVQTPCDHQRCREFDNEFPRPRGIKVYWTPTEHTMADVDNLLDSMLESSVGVNLFD